MKKLLLSLLLGIGITTEAQQGCPTFLKDQSNPYYILFSSNTGIPGAGANQVISNLIFVNAGNWINSGIHYASWTNTSGQPLDINNFSIQFGSQVCTYSTATLGVLDAVKNLKGIPNNRSYKIYSLDGKLLQSGTTSDNFYKELPKNQVLILTIEGYGSMKLKAF